MTDFNGGSGNDIFDGTALDETINGNGGNDVLAGGDGADSVNGGDGDDILFSRNRDPNAFAFISYRGISTDFGTEVDTLIGGNGDDYIVAGYGDNVNGGAQSSYGNRLYITFQGATSGVNADFRLLQSQGSITIGGGVITNIQNIGYLEGSQYDDLLVPIDTGYPTGANVYGRGGNDHLIANYYTGWGGSGLYGGDGDDVVDGRPSIYGAAVYGDAGNDTLYTGYNGGAAFGGDGNDIIYATGAASGGAGNDTIYVQNSSYSGSISGGADDDTIYAASNGSASIFGDAGNDTLIGDTGWDVLTGGAGNDTINGGAQSASGANSYGGDLAVYTGNIADYSITQNSGTGVLTIVDLRTGSPDGTDTVSNIEFLKFANGTYSIAALLSGQATGIMNFVGTPGVDTYYGSEDANTAIGNGGNDTFYGLGGNDVLQGNAGADVLDGGSGDDTLYAGNVSGAFSAPYYSSPWTAPTLDTGSEIDTLIGGDGRDTIFAGYGDTVDGGASDGFGDTLYISFLGASSGVTVDFRQATVMVGGGTITGIENVNWVEGSNFDDDITLTSGNGYGAYTPVFGLGGNDRLIAGYTTGSLWGGDGNDFVDGRGSQYLQTVDGGAGDDILYTPTNSFAAAYGGDGNDTIYAHGTIDGGAGNDTIYIQASYYPGQVRGGADDDTIYAVSNGSANIFGDAGNDTLVGDTGWDVLTGGAGDDTINGGAQSVSGANAYGGDLAVYTGNVADYSITQNSGTGVLTVVDLRTGSPDGTDTVSNIEFLKFANGTYAIAALLSGQATGVMNFVGTPGVDTYYGSEDANTAIGNGGNDTFYGFGGNDVLQGNAGADVLDGGSGDDTLYSGTVAGGFSTPYYGNSWTAPTLDTGSEVDTLIGGDGNDSLFAGYGDNIDGGAGSDTLYVSFRAALSGVAADFRQSSILVGGGTITGIESIGWVEGSSFDDDITVGSGYSSAFTPIFGLGGNDRLIAGYYTGSLWGGDGNDFLDGRGSQYLQTVDGGAGDDILYTPTNSFAAAYGGDGNDTIYAHGTIDGGTGNDTIYIQASYYPGQVRGGTGDDTIYAAQTQGHSAIFGDDGNDALYGSNGVDTLSGGAGADTLDGGTGADTLIGGADNDVYIVDDAADVITELANEGTDEIRTGLASYSLAARVNVEKLTGTAGAGQILTGNGGANVITGLGGNDTLDGGAGADTLIGGAGNDVYFVDDAGDVVNELAGEGTDEIRTGLVSYSLVALANVEKLTGTSGAGQILTGNGGVNVIAGAGGNDTLDGGAGADTLIGGAGNDVYLVDDANDVVTELSDEGIDEIRTTVANYQLAANVEKLTYIGTGSATLGGNANNNSFTGGGNNDSIDVSQGGDDTVNGGDGNDSIFFGANFNASDSIDGGAGSNDQLGLKGDYTGANALRVSGANVTGIETVALLAGFNYSVTALDDLLTTGQRMIIFGGGLGASDTFTFDGSAETSGNFLVYGGFGTDLLTGGGGNDAFSFGVGRFNPGTDVVNGGGGNDQVALNGFSGTISGASFLNVEVIALPTGSNTLTLANDWTLAGQSHIVFGSSLTQGATIDGSAETDGRLALYGGSGNDVLTGGALADQIFGGNGADTIRGGLGGDFLRGDGGADTFVLGSAADSTGINYDTLVRFDASGDKIDLPGSISAIEAAITTGTLSNASFDSDLTAALAGLGANHAVTFTANQGDLAGRIFLIADTNGIAGYQAGQDAVFQLQSPVQPITDTGVFI